MLLLLLLLRCCRCCWAAAVSAAAARATADAKWCRGAVLFLRGGCARAAGASAGCLPGLPPSLLVPWVAVAAQCRLSVGLALGTASVLHAGSFLASQLSCLGMFGRGSYSSSLRCVVSPLPSPTRRSACGCAALLLPSAAAPALPPLLFLLSSSASFPCSGSRSRSAPPFGVHGARGRFLGGPPGSLASSARVALGLVVLLFVYLSRLGVACVWVWS